MFGRRFLNFELAFCLAFIFFTGGCDEDKVVDTSSDQSPMPPAMLGAQIISPRSIEIYWLDMSYDETAFLVYRGESDSMDMIGLTQADQSIFTDESPRDTTDYYYCVSAVNAHGESPSLDTILITTPDWSSAPVEPYSPYPADSAEMSSTDIVLRWSCSDADYDEELIFDVYFGNSSPPQLAVSDYADSSSSYYYYYYDPGQLEASTNYYWKIVAKDEQGHETVGPIWSFRTLIEINSIGHFSFPGNSSKIYVSGDYAYLINSWIGIIIADISVAEDPVMVTAIPTSIPAVDVQAVDSYLYVLCSIDFDYSSLLIFDVTNPAAPFLAGSYDSLEHPHAVVLDNNYAYVASNSSGLRIIDISNPANPILEGFYDDLNGAYDVALDGNYAYIADVTSGLHIFDITDPANPVQAGALAISGGADRISIAGNYAYLVDYYLSLVIMVNIENPANPRFVTYYQSGDYARNIFTTTDYAFLACGNSGLEILDITNPPDPTLAGDYNIAYSLQDIFVVGNIAYLANGSQGLLILECEP